MREEHFSWGELCPTQEKPYSLEASCGLWPAEGSRALREREGVPCRSSETRFEKLQARKQRVKVSVGSWQRLQFVNCMMNHYLFPIPVTG